MDDESLPISSLQPVGSASDRHDVILFVTGKLAEPALRRVLNELAPRVGFRAEVAVMPITVAALLTTDWIARRLQVPTGTQRVILPGFCRGELAPLQQVTEAAVERGPKDLRDLPEFFGQASSRPADYGEHDLQILAEINHAPQLSADALLRQARQFVAEGADLIDLGCDPGSTWSAVGSAVRALRAEGIRVSIDTFNPTEATQALEAGAELVLSVNATNRVTARAWAADFPHAEVVVIPDTPSTLAGLETSIEELREAGLRLRVDPILEPIGFGFAASLGRYLEVRQRWPEVEMLMGVGNLTEMTDVDSAGLNVLLAGFCREQSIRSVLTTAVINWARSSVRELDRARRLVHYAVTHRLVPKRLEPSLVMLRDPKIADRGEAELLELARQVTDRNYRLFAERGELHIINGSMYLRGTDPFALFAEMRRRDPSLDASHAFYLGYELAKAVTALTLSKMYQQDQALQWGLLTRPEPGGRA